MRQYCNSEGVRSSRDSCQFVCAVVKNVKCWFQLGGNSIEDSEGEVIKQEGWGQSLTAFLSLGVSHQLEHHTAMETNSKSLKICLVSDFLKVGYSLCKISVHDVL